MLKTKPSWTLYSVIITVIMLLLYGIVFGRKQEEQYLSDYTLYKKTQSDIYNGNMAEANSNFATLLPKFSNSAEIIQTYAWFLASSGYYDNAIKQYKRARDLKPLIIMDQHYLFSVGFTYYLAGNKDMAKSYLTKSIKDNPNKEEVFQAAQLLNKINSPQAR